MRRLLLVLIALLSLGAVLAAPAQAAWIWPVRGEVITPYRNGSDPYAGGQHRGIDIAAAVGTPVVAAAGGEVRFAGTAGTSGLTVSVRTGDGFDTSYLHLSSIAVRAGVHVSGGERLGAVGTTGERSATPPHLHFGVREAGTRHAYLDPLSFLPPATAPPPSEAPHPAPAPAPAPLTLRPAPAPAPSGAPRPAPAPSPAPAPRGAPRPAPVPGRAPRAAPTPRGAPRAAPAPVRAPQPAPVSREAPRPAPVPGAEPIRGRIPVSAPAPALASPHELRPPVPSRPPAAATHPHALDREGAPASGGSAAPSMPRNLSPAAPSGSGGPELGWALASAGLLLAAGILGLTDDRRKATARSRLAGALRPLLGRR